MSAPFDSAAVADMIGDADIEWAVRILGLPPQAFVGADGNDPRVKVMQAACTIDVAACPGSGKTTLLVAKLAILARHWAHAGQGVCVLSHTNVARMEIERRLSGDPVCRAILGYPHFIGTIHGFINTFVALPWMRSQGLQANVIDDELCTNRRWGKLTPQQRFALEQNRKSASVMRIVDTAFGLGDVQWRTNAPLGRNTNTYQAMVAACRAAADDGYFCHREMFLWAEQALDRLPDLAASIRHRFPVHFLDEVQDNDEDQSRLLYRIFMEGEGPVLRHRFGDMNQAIYGSGDAEDVLTDPFPDPDVLVAVPNSHRFDQLIADAADPVATTTPGLVGLKPTNPERPPLALMLFDPACAASVLPAYAQLLTERFTPDERSRGTFAAVGSVQRDNGSGDIPSCIIHYWADYNLTAAAKEASPKRFLEFVERGRVERGEGNDVYPVVERVAEALLRLASILNSEIRYPPRASRHRQLLSLLDGNFEQRKLYLRLAMALATGPGPANAAEWKRWRPYVMSVARTLLRGAEAGAPDDFLDWVHAAALDPAGVRRDNFFRYPAVEPTVHVKVGTIHSVKGETHNATLVLDTHFNGSHLARIKNWLTGIRVGVGAADRGVNLRKSLKQHYVAMTRPSDLLCIAMRRDHVAPEDVALFRARKWAVGDVANGVIQWRE